jgi:hypothetical protein
MRYWLIHWLLSGVALLIVARIVPGIQVDGFGAALIAAFVIGLVGQLWGNSKVHSAAIHHPHARRCLFLDQRPDVETGFGVRTRLPCQWMPASRARFNSANYRRLHPESYGTYLSYRTIRRDVSRELSIGNNRTRGRKLSVIVAKIRESVTWPLSLDLSQR